MSSISSPDLRCGPCGSPSHAGSNASSQSSRQSRQPERDRRQSVWHSRTMRAPAFDEQHHTVLPAHSLWVAAFSTIVEWYDFTLYLYLATVLSRVFYGGGAK